MHGGGSYGGYRYHQPYKGTYRCHSADRGQGVGNRSAFGKVVFMTDIASEGDKFQPGNVLVIKAGEKNGALYGDGLRNYCRGGRPYSHAAMSRA